jgi:hypothetical protein
MANHTPVALRNRQNANPPARIRAAKKTQPADQGRLRL